MIVARAARVWTAVLVSLLGSAAAGASGGGLADAAWERVGDADGISVFRSRVTGSDVLAFKAAAVIDSPIAKVASVLVDNKREPEWLPNLKESRILRQLSPTQRIEYTHVGTPPMVKDRDFVLRGEAALDAEKRLVLSFHSVEDAEAPSTRCVRGEMRASSYTLWPTADGRKTNLVFVVHADPKGVVPKWIINFFQEGYPRRVIRAIRRQSLRADVAENQDVRRAFAGALGFARGLQ